MELLRQVPLLSEFPDEQLRLLAFSAENVSYRDGEVLFSSGERADAGLVVASGAITLESDDGSVKPVTFGPGSLIGETALLVETRRPARAVASGASEVIRIRRALFKRMLQEFPDIARRLFDARGGRSSAPRSVRFRASGMCLSRSIARARNCARTSGGGRRRTRRVGGRTGRAPGCVRPASARRECCRAWRASRGTRCGPCRQGRAPCRRPDLAARCSGSPRCRTRCRRHAGRCRHPR